MTDSGYEPSNELIEAARQLGFWASETKKFLAFAVAFRTVDGHPELVPWRDHARAIDVLLHQRAEVEALVTAAQAMVDASLIDGLVWSVEGLRAALVPFTEHQEEK